MKITLIVKKSSPKNLSADSQPTVGRLSADSWLTVGRLSADRRPTGFARNIGYLLTDSVPTVDRQSANRFFGELFFTITKITMWGFSLYVWCWTINNNSLLKCTFDFCAVQHCTFVFPRVKSQCKRTSYCNNLTQDKIKWSLLVL